MKRDVGSKDIKAMAGLEYYTLIGKNFAGNFELFEKARQAGEAREAGCLWYHKSRIVIDFDVRRRTVRSTKTRVLEGHKVR